MATTMGLYTHSQHDALHSPLTPTTPRSKYAAHALVSISGGRETLERGADSMRGTGASKISLAFGGSWYLDLWGAAKSA